MPDINRVSLRESREEARSPQKTSSAPKAKARKKPAKKSAATQKNTTPTGGQAASKPEEG